MQKKNNILSTIKLSSVILLLSPWLKVPRNNKKPEHIKQNRRYQRTYKKKQNKNIAIYSVSFHFTTHSQQKISIIHLKINKSLCIQYIY